MLGWHHWLNGHEFEQTPGADAGQGSLTCCSPWGTKSGTQLSNWTIIFWTVCSRICFVNLLSYNWAQLLFIVITDTLVLTSAFFPFTSFFFLFFRLICWSIYCFHSFILKQIRDMPSIFILLLRFYQYVYTRNNPVDKYIISLGKFFS